MDDKGSGLLILQQFDSFVTCVHFITVFVQVDGMAELGIVLTQSQFPSRPCQILAKSQSFWWMQEIVKRSRAQTRKACLHSTTRPLRLIRGMLTSS